jgi:hypothetical protein
VDTRARDTSENKAEEGAEEIAGAEQESRQEQNRKQDFII